MEFDAPAYMTNSVLKKLRSRKVSAQQIADLLEKHIGDGLNEIHCRDACEALGTIRSEELRRLVHIVDVIFRNGDNYCNAVRRVIAVLRAQPSSTPSEQE
jgi:hypothetical protein